MDGHERDDTQGHGLRIGVTSGLLALALGVASKQVQLIRDAARLHDIGKIGVPDSIRLAPRALSAAEYEIMKQHTVIGAGLLAGGETQILRLAE